ncbi:UDP-glucose 4-epimerase GalE [Prochlorococcus marinus XMU1412]|uniref:UDP-glucose 4-epimerase GalE n=1 Tax=Prochlorococcus marinus TaxID=1219 RepID=UPI001AD9F1FB|nr:UDP-glucose 4-epimerase GalE [Prochlorococcus marinus]MBO8240547.1 UDP-glucose 4-epimerase GalE [Prochlorococcus marinus XMU1412]MBW3071782.1 UDP-glucose 4-epimerase GalE [Prochlorococcus marinus str. MU1412]
MYILVTGGAGYIGSHTVRALQKENFEVVVLDNLIYGHKKIVENVLKVPLIVGDIGNKELITQILSGKHPKTNGKKIMAVIHFAAFAYVGESVKKPLKYYINNVKKSISFFESIFEESSNRSKGEISRQIPIVFSSTCATYGIPKKLPIIESTEQNPINPYGRSKLMIENILKDLYFSHNIPSMIFRYFNAAGADPKGDIGENHIPETHLIPLAFDALTKEKCKFQLFGNDYQTFDGTCIRDYIHVTDIADAHVKGLIKILNEGGQHIYNLGTGNGLSVKQVLKSIEKVTNLELNIEIHPRRQGDPPILVASPNKALNELNWKPSYSNIDTIVEHAWKWYQRI